MTTRRNVVIALVVAYCALAVYLQLILEIRVIYSHFAYIPVILAGLWWGWRAVGIAAFLGVVTIAIGLPGASPQEIGYDALNLLILLAVAVCIAAVGGRRAGGRVALQEWEAKYRFLVEKCLAGIYVYRDDRILFANQRISDMTGYTPEEMLGMSIWDLVLEEDEPKVREMMRRRREEGLQDLHYECRLNRKDGEVIWVEILSSVADNEEEPAVLVHAHDVTGKKKAEEERWNLQGLAARQETLLAHATRLAELGEMAGMIAHEINQPLTGIRNFAKNASYMIEHEAGSLDEVKENLGRISAQVDRAASIISHVRELTRRHDPEFSLLDVNEVVTSAVEFLAPQMELSGVNVILSLDEHLPRIQGHRVRLEQVLLNLLSNAKRAMRDSPERRIVVRTCMEAGQPRPLVIAVEDSGEGFEPQAAESLFQPFFTTKETSEGTGLGLSISSTIVKEHEGKIEAVGEPGGGATFTIRLPLPEREETHE